MKQIRDCCDAFAGLKAQRSSLISLGFLIFLPVRSDLQLLDVNVVFRTAQLLLARCVHLAESPAEFSRVHQNLKL